MAARGTFFELQTEYDVKPSGTSSQNSPTSPTSNTDQVFPTGKSTKHARGVSFREDVKDNTKQSAQSGKMTPETSGTSQAHATIDQPILDMASECDDAFIEAIDGSEPDLRTSLEEYQKRFHAWASYLGVFSSHRSNLDRRLRLHPEIEDIVLSTLDMLLTNLVQLVPKHLRDPAAPFNTGQVALDGVRSAVVELNKLGMNIRQSSSTDLESRVKSFAVRRLQEEIRKFAPVALAAIKTLYPNAATSLHDQLCKSVVNRYAKLLYWRSHANKLGADLRPKSDIHPQEPNSDVGMTMTSQETRGKLGHVVPTGLEHWAQVRDQAIGLGESHHFYHDISATDPSTMGPLGAGKKRAFNSDARSSDASSIMLSGVGYPRPPKINEADNEAACDMCCKKFDRKQYEDERWWRQHVHQDLTPFICISQDCVDESAFSSSRDWRSHMSEQHDEEWSQRVHVSPTWYCDVCGEQSLPYSSVLQLEDHVRASHQTILEDFRSFSSSSIPRETRPLGVCPLCCNAVELPKGATLDATDNVLDGLPDITMDQSPTLVVRTNDSASKRQKVTSDDGTSHHRATSENDNIDSLVAETSQPVDPHRLSLILALSRHIAEHLQYLTFLTLRLMPHKLCEDGQEGQEDETCQSDQADGDQADGASNPLDDEQMSWGTDSSRTEEANHDSYGRPVDWRELTSLNLFGTSSSGEVDEMEGPLYEIIVTSPEGEEHLTARPSSLGFNLIAHGTVNRLTNPQVTEMADSKTIHFGDTQFSSSYCVKLTWYRPHETVVYSNEFWIVDDGALRADVLLGDRSVRDLNSNDNGVCDNPTASLSEIALRIAPRLARWLTKLELIVKARQKSGVFKPTKVAILDNGMLNKSSVSHEAITADDAAGGGGESHNTTTASGSKNQGRKGPSGTGGKHGSTTSAAKADADLREDNRNLWTQIVEGHSFVGGESRFSTWFSAPDPHGTQMANLICAIDPFCKLYVARVSKDQSGISAESVKKAIEWARRKDVDVISMSFVLEESDKSLSQEIERASDQGIVMVCSARDEGSRFAEAYPAADGLRKRSIIALAASDENGKPLYDLNDDEYNYIIRGQYAAAGVVPPTVTGTSAATALAAGISSLTLTCDRLVNPDGSYAPGVEEGSRYEMVRDHMDMMQSTKDSKFVLLDKFNLIDTSYIRDILSSAGPPNHTAILQSLDYTGRSSREAAISTAYATTFEWIFNGSEFHFQSWLQQDNGCFWINGKPGSGKSTLMKLIAGHPHTAKALSTWAGPNQLVTACHYLWSPGTAMQKSLEGLFRSILYSILRGAPELIPAVCSSERTKSSASANAPWLKAELIATMQNFAQLTESPVKCCIFIDELDALDWGLPEAVLLISDFAQSPHCKICVSSRPWNLFEFAFGSDPMRRLRIHDLTRPDTEAYVRVQLENHPSWPYNQGRDGTAAYLIREITDRADGVFLWVVLVTKSILMGVTNGDTISVLRQRIDAFPTDMESLFKESLETVSPFYRENMADSLLIALAATSPLHVAIYHFCQEGDYDAQPTRPLTVKELSDLVQNTSRRLENQSKGLLEVRNDNCVHFLHRTVCDFLLTAEMTNYLQTRCRRNFSPSLSIFRASVEWIKRSSFPSEIDNRGEPDVNNQPQLGQALLTSALTEALQYATISKAENEVATHGALGALERSIGTMAESGQIILSWEAGGLSAAIQARHLFRELAHQFGLGGYLQMQEG